MARTAKDAAYRGDPGRSRFIRVIALVPLLLAAAPPTGGVTATQAHDLPAPELARLVLGETGAALVKEVERPIWMTGPLAAPPPPGMDPSRDPPPLVQLAFFTQPKGWDVAGSAPWSSLCYRTKVRVDFGAGGVARDVTTEMVFAGLPGPYRGRGTADDTARFQRECSTLSYRRFFQAPNWWSAENVIGAVDALHDAMKRGPVDYLTIFCSVLKRVTCSSATSPEAVSRIVTDRIAGIEAVDCGTRRFAAPPLLDQTDVCYSVGLGTDVLLTGENVFNELFLSLHVADGRILIREARLARLSVVY